METFSPDTSSSLALPLFSVNVSAGFPSPAEGEIDTPLDLNAHLIPHPAATFFVRVRGDSMQGAGIFSGDLLIVDRSLSAKDNAIIVAILNGEFTVKRLKIRHRASYKNGDLGAETQPLSDLRYSLVPENPAYPIVEVSTESDFQVWGVVTYVIHKTS